MLSLSLSSSFRDNHTSENAQFTLDDSENTPGVDERTTLGGHFLPTERTVHIYCCLRDIPLHRRVRDGIEADHESHHDGEHHDLSSQRSCFFGHDCARAVSPKIWILRIIIFQLKSQHLCYVHSILPKRSAHEVIRFQLEPAACGKAAFAFVR